MNITVVGSGFSSLSAASYLAHQGHEVTILEKNVQPGGRARQYREKGFVFDIGPTWYWMPDIFEKFFADFGKDVSDYYQLERLDPSYRIYSGIGQHEDIPADFDALFALFEKYQPGSGIHLKRFLDQAEMTYNLAVKEMAFKPGNSLFEFVSKETVSHAHLFVQSLRTQVRKRFRHPFLIALLEFPVLFLGAKPGDIPAFYNFMNYADLKLGTWYPMKGMYSVVEAMVKLALESGVKILTNCPVLKFNVKEGMITSVETEKGRILTDGVVSGADYCHTESLLEPQYRNYTEE
jgi:phytoene desaturase